MSQHELTNKKRCKKIDVEFYIYIVQIQQKMYSSKSDRQTPSSAEVKNVWSCTLTSHAQLYLKMSQAGRNVF